MISIKNYLCNMLFAVSEKVTEILLVYALFEEYGNNNLIVYFCISAFLMSFRIFFLFNFSYKILQKLFFTIIIIIIIIIIHNIWKKSCFILIIVGRCCEALPCWGTNVSNWRWLQEEAVCFLENDSQGHSYYSYQF